MTITIEDRVQYTPPVDGFVQREFSSVSERKQSASATLTTAATTLRVTGAVTYTDGTTESGVTLVPPLRPSPNAALHVVSSVFVALIPGLTKKRIRRFM